MLQKSDYNEQYYHGGGAIGGYDNYSETTYFSENHQALSLAFQTKLADNGISLSGKKILVTGCAFGFLVKYLVQLGADAYGVDISPYAISQAPAEIAARVMVGDVSVTATFSAAKTMAGLRNNQRFEAIIDEDMLCCLTDAEAVNFRSQALSASNIFLHLVDQADNLSQWYNYKTIAAWKAFLGNSPKEKWYSRFGMTEH